MSNEETQSQTQRRADRGNKENAGSRESEAQQERSTKKAADIIAEAQASPNDTGQEIAAACSKRAHALHAILSTRKLQH